MLCVFVAEAYGKKQRGIWHELLIHQEETEREQANNQLRIQNSINLLALANGFRALVVGGRIKFVPDISCVLLLL